jgi:hypothetical protein
MWSIDAWALVRPARAFQFVAAHPATGSTVRLLFGRPLFLVFVLGCVVSLAASSVLTARLVVPAAIYWSVVPIIEIGALAAVSRRRPRAMSFGQAVDAFFIGHAVWTVALVGIVGVIALMHPASWWWMLVNVGAPSIALVLAWSAYTDFCFLKYVMDFSPSRAVLRMIVLRLITWTLVVGIFASDRLTPWGIVHQIVEAIRGIV